MTISRWTAAGALAMTLLAGLFIGWYTTPKRVVERDHIVTVDRDVSAHLEAYVGRTETVNHTEIVYNTRTEWRSDGTVVAITEAASATNTHTTNDVRAAKVEIREVVKYKDKETIKIVESARKDWLISGQVGVHFDDLRTANLVYSVGVQRRILGPFSVGGWLQGSGLKTEGTAGGVSVGVTF